jgi:hypothetical protein
MKPQGREILVVKPGPDTTVDVVQFEVEVVPLVVLKPALGKLLFFTSTKYPPTPAPTRIITTTAKAAVEAIAFANF